MKKILFLWLFAFSAVLSAAKTNPYVDSLENVLVTHDLSLNERLVIYEDIANACCVSDIGKTMIYARKALPLALELNDHKKECALYQQIGSMHNVEGRFDSALYYYKKSLELAKEIKDKPLEVHAYRMHTFVYFREGNYIMALQSCVNVLNHCEELGDLVGVAGSLGCIGEIYQIIGNTERALYYTKRSLEISETNNFDFITTQVYNIMGAIYMDMGDYDEALRYRELALKTSIIGNNRLNESISLHGMAKVYLYWKDYDTAIEYANKALTIGKETGDPTLIVNAWSTLSTIYLKQERYKECEETALSAWSLDSTNLNSAPDLAYNIALSNIYLGNTQKAEVFLNKNTELSKEKSGRSLHQSLLEMEIKYETEKKEMRIGVLEKERALYVWLSLACVTILILALGLLLFRHRLIIQKRKLVEQQMMQFEQEKLLITTQALLDGETAERSRLGRDLHDGLGGILSVVKLNLNDMKCFSDETNPDSIRFTKALKMLDQGIVELRQIAHHMMPESLLHSGLKVSIEDFCRSVPGAHFQYIGEDMRLDSHLEVLIYRCAYELVNNAIKHANATQINIQLLVDNSILSLTVQDNGIGFEQGTVTLGSGLENLRARISAYNGKMNIYSSPGNGTEVIIEIESYL